MTTARGLEGTMGYYFLLDRTPMGRNEGDLSHGGYHSAEHRVGTREEWLAELPGVAVLHHGIDSTDAMMQTMRTTVTLEPDVDALVKRAMRERGLNFKQAVNEAIRLGMARPRDTTELKFPTHDMGDAQVDVTKALRLAGELEDQELAARIARGS